MALEAKLKRPIVYATVLILLAFASANVFLYLSGEHHIYAHDFRNYWIASWQSSLRFSQSISYWWQNLRESIWVSDYNSLFAAPLLPYSLTFGYARIGFILGIALTYLIPAVLLSAAAACLVIRDRSTPTFMFVVFSAFAALYVPYWKPTLLGLPDIVGLIPLVLAFMLILTSGFGERIRPGYALLLGLLIWMPFLFRRWYAFAIVAFVLSAPLFCWFTAVTEGRTSWISGLKNTLFNFAIAGVLAATLLLIAQGALVERIWSTSYSEIYVAYQRPWWGHISHFYHTFGGIYLALAILGQVTLFTMPRKRLHILLIDFNVIAIFLLFIRTQGFGPQHYIPLAFWLFTLICLGTWVLVSSAPRIAPTLTAGSLAVALVVFTMSFYRTGFTPMWASLFLPEPEYNNKIGSEAQYVKLARTLNALLKPGEKFTVFGSSTTLHRDVLLSASREVLTGKDLDTSHVDLMQGLSIAPFMAQYAVVADPIQTHLPPQTQSVITIPARAIREGQGIGAAYKRLDREFPITRSAKAYIFTKMRPFTADEVESMMGDFYRVYPEWRQTYGNPVFKLAMTSSTELGDQWGQFDYVPGGKLITHPGETKPTRFTFPGFGSTLHISVRAPCDGADGVSVQLLESEANALQMDIGPGETATLPKLDIGKTYTIVVGKRGNPWCDAVTISE